MSSQKFAKKTQKSFIRLLAPLKIYLFIWRCINSFYTCIHKVAGARSFLLRNTSAPMPLSPAHGRLQSASVCCVDVQLVAELGGHGQELWIYRPRSLPPLRRRPWNGGGVKCLTLIGLSMTFFVNIDNHRHCHFRHPIPSVPIMSTNIGLTEKCLPSPLLDATLAYS